MPTGDCVIGPSDHAIMLYTYKGGHNAMYGTYYYLQLIPVLHRLPQLQHVYAVKLSTATPYAYGIRLILGHDEV